MTGGRTQTQWYLGGQFVPPLVVLSVKTLTPPGCAFKILYDAAADLDQLEQIARRRPRHHGRPALGSAAERDLGPNGHHQRRRHAAPRDPGRSGGDRCHTRRARRGLISRRARA